MREEIENELSEFCRNEHSLSLIGTISLSKFLNTYDNFTHASITS